MNHIETPAVLLDLSVLERNIKRFQQLADRAGKTLWPMIKTHKSTEIARMQHDSGAAGFLCGTLDECEVIYENLVHKEGRNISIMYAYPVACRPNISRVVKLAKNCDFYLRIDSSEQAALLNEAAAEADVHINYSVIINAGLDRFGVDVCELENLLRKISDFKYLKFAGISTHPGHVYREENIAGVAKIAAQECNKMKDAASILHSMGIEPIFISSGSTPTYPYAVNDSVINILHPGNYVFMDNMQISLECASEEDCALTVLATVISAPRKGEFIIDAGSKCLGLDKGAHGTGKIVGHGRIKSQENSTWNDAIVISSLSEEVGKIIVSDKREVSFKIGDKIEIIPNHSCAVGNNTSCYIGMRNGVFESVIDVDMRNNLTRRLSSYAKF